MPRAGDEQNDSDEDEDYTRQPDERTLARQQAKEKRFTKFVHRSMRKVCVCFFLLLMIIVVECGFLFLLLFFLLLLLLLLLLHNCVFIIIIIIIERLKSC
jgi:hypothetical protein